MVVQSAYSIAVESLLLHFKVGAYQELRCQLLDCKADGVRGIVKSPVAHRSVSLATARGKQLRRGAVVKSVHAFCLRHCRRPMLLPRQLVAT